jgi:hypothetical protein
MSDLHLDRNLANRSLTGNQELQETSVIIAVKAMDDIHNLRMNCFKDGDKACCRATAKPARPWFTLATADVAD